MNSSKPHSRPLIHNFWTRIAVAYPFGLAPWAPGTFGSLPGLALGYGLYRLSHGLGSDHPWAPYAVAGVCIAALVGFAWLVIDRTEKLWSTHDDGRIVIDEVVGQAIPLAFLGVDLLTLGLSFVIFRFLDIAKPGLIGWCDENLPGAWGTLLDDVLAGICTVPLVFALSSLLYLAL